MINKLQFRIASEADALPLAAIAERTFRDTFAQANTAADMNQHWAERFGRARQLAEIRDPATSTLQVELESRLGALGQLRRGPAPEAVRGRKPVEIFRFYVDAPWHGRGIPPQLMTRLLDPAATAVSIRKEFGMVGANC